jgi:hypothetical protein
MLRRVTFAWAMAVVLSMGIRAIGWQAQKPNDWAMNNALIGPDSPIEVPAGGSYNAQVMYPVPDGPLFPLKADVVWWIEPAVKGILIEAKSGHISVAQSVPKGTTATIYADVTGRKTKLQARLYVYSQAENPLVGTWQVESVQACAAGATLSPSAQSAPFAAYHWKFYADRRFWIGRPFGMAATTGQSGTYHYSNKASTLSMKPEWPKGKARTEWSISPRADGSKLELKASKPQDGHGPVCGYVLTAPRRQN